MEFQNLAYNKKRCRYNFSTLKNSTATVLAPYWHRQAPIRCIVVVLGRACLAPEGRRFIGRRPAGLHVLNISFNNKLTYSPQWRHRPVAVSILKLLVPMSVSDNRRAPA